MPQSRKTFTFHMVICLVLALAGFFIVSPAFAGCPLSTAGMSTRLYLPSTGERVYCVYEDRDYRLQVFGPNNNNAYCIEPVNGNAAPRTPVGFDPSASCLDAGYGDVERWWIHTLASVPSGGIEGGLSPYGCTGQNYTLEHVFNYAKCPATACTPPPDDMKAWFPLDETSGTTVRDITNTLSGTRYGASIVNGRVSKALSFDGSNDYVSIPDSTPYYTMAISTGDFTIDAWIKTSKSNGIIVSKRDNNFAGYLFMVYSGRLLLQMGDSSYYNNYLAPSSSPRVDDGNWHFVAVTVDRDNTSGGKMYIDGNLVYTFNPTAFRYRTLLNSVPLRMGQTAQGDSYARFSGIIDEVELFSRALSESDLDAIWAAGSNGKCKTTPRVCGNGVCESNKGESCSNCSADCGPCPACGNGLCEFPNENCLTCPNDCQPCPNQCDGDGICELGEGPDCIDCCFDQPLNLDGSVDPKNDSLRPIPICPY